MDPKVQNFGSVFVSLQNKFRFAHCSANWVI